MTLSMTETVSRIKRAGTTNVRAVPMPKQAATGGMYQIEVKEGNAWLVIAEGLPQTTANDLISQAVSRLICG